MHRYILPRHWLTSDFLSFIVVELIRFFHGALNLFSRYMKVCARYWIKFSELIGYRPGTDCLDREHHHVFIFDTSVDTI